AEFAQFLAAARAATDREDLSRLAPERFEAGMRHAYERVASYRGEASQIFLTEPSAAGEPLSIDVISPDMPFIVDSALAAVRAAGGTVRLFSHPVVHDDDGRRLSVLHIQSDPVADLEALRSEIAATMADVTLAVRDWQPMLDRLHRVTAALSPRKG